MFIKNQPSVEGSLKKTESDGGGGFGIFINLKVISFIDSSMGLGRIRIIVKCLGGGDQPKSDHY